MEGRTKLSFLNCTTVMPVETKVNHRTKMLNTYSRWKKKASWLQWEQYNTLLFLTCFTGGVIAVACGLRGCWLFSFCACSCSLANFCFSSSVSDALKRESTNTKLDSMVIYCYFYFINNTVNSTICGRTENITYIKQSG